MQNKFTKGILERQEREFKAQKAAQPAGEPTAAPTPEPQTTPEPPQIPAPITPPKPAVTAPAPSAEAKPAPAQDSADPLSAFIVRDNGRKAKNKTFYLDGAVIQAIRRAAAAQHVPESKLVNDILKKILLPADGTH